MAKYDDEFYDIYQIYLSNGIVPRISLTKQIMKHRNREGLRLLTNCYLKQNQLTNEDCVLLRLGDFERVLIFDRDRSGLFSPA